MMLPIMAVVVLVRSTEGVVEPTEGVETSAGGVVGTAGGMVGKAEDKLLVEDGDKLPTAGGVTPLVNPDKIHNTVTV